MKKKKNHISENFRDNRKGVKSRLKSQNEMFT